MEVSLEWSARLHTSDIHPEPDAFREKYGIHAPFVLYARKQHSDALLFTYFAEYIKRNNNPLMLVMIGEDNLACPETLVNNRRFLDLLITDRQERCDALAAAEVLCLPMINPVSLTDIMEIWLCGRPVLVHDHCAVTRNFCQESHGGLYFADYFEFEGCVDYFLHHKDIAGKMGLSGREYVLSHFDWEIITERYRTFFETIDQRGN